MRKLLIWFYKIQEKQKGVTLMELLIAGSLIAITLSLAYSIYLFGVQGYLNNTTILENQSNVRIALEHITFHIRRCKDVSIIDNVLVVGQETYSLSKDILMNKNNQLAIGISEFTFYKPKPSLVYIKVSSVPDKNGDIFSLDAYFYLGN